LARAAGDTIHGGVQEFGPVGSGGDSKFRRIRAFFSVLAVVSGQVLLIACGNVAGLLMARGTARRPEIAIRLAIGGTRWRIVQQLMAEAFWLALIGTVAGLGLSLGAMRTINAISLPIALPIELHLGIDRPVLLAAVALVMATMVACALIPALGAIRSALGATRGRILRLVLRDSSVLVGVGVAVGLGIAALATRGLSTFLVAGLEATDPISFLGTAAVFLLVAILASWIPARRGLRVDPAAAIRVD
jgi:ABC-type antimicrobial peptide transport system permease subunit